jgi:hypothetical protein
MAWTAPAFAQRVVLVRPKDPDPALSEAFNRLRGEMGMHGFEVIVVDATDQPSAAALAEVAERHTAVASVAFARAAGQASADVWVSDRVTGKTSLRSISTPAEADAPSLLALRATELLRASLREFPSAEAQPADIVGAEPARAPTHVREWAKEPVRDSSKQAHRAAWWLELDAACLLPLPETSPALGPSAWVGHRPGEVWSVRAGFEGPLLGTELRTPEATAQIRYLVGLAEVGIDVRSTDQVALDLALSAGAMNLSVQGEAEGAWVGRTDSRWVLAGGAGADLTWAALDSVGLRTSVRALWTSPQTEVEIASTSFRVGRPSLLINLGVVVGL